MRVSSLTIFDDQIKGTGPWYTPANVTKNLGAVDACVVQAVTTAISSPAPTLTVTPQHSSDGTNWATAASAAINTTVAEGTGYASNKVDVELSHLRFKIALGAAGDACWLKLHFTGRTKAAR